MSTMQSGIRNSAIELSQSASALTPVFAVVLFGLVLALTGACSYFQLASNWTPTSALTEGNSEAWAELPGHFFSDQNVFVAVGNDSQYLHLLVRFRAADENWVRACAMSGLTVWFDPSGKKKKTLGIRFPNGPSRENPPLTDASHESERSDIPALRANQPLDGQFEVNTKGSSIIITADGTSGPSGRFASESGMYTYELSIPLAATADRWVAIGDTPGSTVMLGLTAGLSEEERGIKPKLSQQGDAGAGDEPGSGMSGQGPGPGHSPDGENSLEANPEVWARIQLARTGEAAGVVRY